MFFAPSLPAQQIVAALHLSWSLELSYCSELWDKPRVGQAPSRGGKTWWDSCIQRLVLVSFSFGRYESSNWLKLLKWEQEGKPRLANFCYPANSAGRSSAERRSSQGKIPCVVLW